MFNLARSNLGKLSQSVRRYATAPARQSHVFDRLGSSPHVRAQAMEASPSKFLPWVFGAILPLYVSLFVTPTGHSAREYDGYWAERELQNVTVPHGMNPGAPPRLGE